MWCELRGVSYVVQYMRQELTYQFMQSMQQETAYSSMRCELCGVSYVVQSMWQELAFSCFCFGLSTRPKSLPRDERQRAPAGAPDYYLDNDTPDALQFNSRWQEMKGSETVQATDATHCVLASQKRVSPSTRNR